jgi:hypothetical protein
MDFVTMAKKHWTRELPELTRQLKAAGTFETTVQEAADQAKEELGRLVSRGMGLMAAREIVEMEYILLPPEIIE